MRHTLYAIFHLACTQYKWDSCCILFAELLVLYGYHICIGSMYHNLFIHLFEDIRVVSRLRLLIKLLGTFVYTHLYTLLQSFKIFWYKMEISHTNSHFQDLLKINSPRNIAHISTWEQWRRAEWLSSLPRSPPSSVVASFTQLHYLPVPIGFVHSHFLCSASEEMQESRCIRQPGMESI